MLVAIVTIICHRCLANLAAHQAGCDQLTMRAGGLLATVSDMAPFPNKNLEIAAATLLLNCTVLMTRNTKGRYIFNVIMLGYCCLNALHTHIYIY